MAIETNELIDVQTLSPFKRFIMTIGNLPTSYLESMTYGELLMWFCNYLQETVIPAVNNNALAVEELQNLYEELHDYVENYFDNLDVQEEINTKLDQMVEDGTLTLLIKNYVDPIQEAFEETINATVTLQNSSIAGQNTEINTLKSRMDTFSSLTEGSTTGDAELADVRVSYTGETYSNAGDAVRSQSEEIAKNVGVPIVNLASKDINSNKYEWGSVTSGSTLRFKINDYTGTPTSFIIYGKTTEGGTWNTLLYANTADKINALKNDYHDFTFQNNYYMIRLFMAYNGTGMSENVNIIAFMTTDKNINNRVFKLESDFNSLDVIEKESGLNIIDLASKDINSNKYDYGTVAKDDTLIYKLEDYTGTPSSFLIYARVNEESAWETLVNANTSEKIEALKDNFNTLTFTKNYGLVRFYMAYSGTGLSESTQMLASLYSEDNLLSLTMKNKEDILNLESSVGNDVYKIFRKIVCCGDSYTAGYISAGGQTSQFNENYSWPHYMATSSNNEYKNCGITGATCKTWQSNPYGLAKAQSFGLTQAYITGFGINDSNPLVDVYLPVGTTSDVNYDNDTFYSQYAKLIRALHNISPDAHIFMQTCPDNDTSRYNPYNEAIRYIADLYHDDYHTHCLDLVNYKDLYNKLSITQDHTNSHYSAIGYEQFAEILKIVMSDYIKSHISEFQTVAFINY